MKKSFQFILFLVLMLVVTSCMSSEEVGATQTPTYEFGGTLTNLPDPTITPTLKPSQTPTPEEDKFPKGIKFKVFDPGSNSILPAASREDLNGINTEAGGMVYYDGQFHLFYNVLQDYPPTEAVIGYAVSSDGYTWERREDVQIFSAKNVSYADNVILASDVIVEDDGTWVLYFHTTSSDPTEVGSRIGRATASSPTGPWRADPSPALEPTEGSWDSFEVKYPCVVNKGNSYFMYYQGTDSNGGTISFGVAESKDGVNWNKISDPIFTGEQVPWGKYNSIRYPYVILTEQGWFMFYRVSGDEYNYAVGLALSSDGVNWAPAQGGPAFDVEGQSSWSMIFALEVEYVGDTLYIFVQTIADSSTTGYLNLITYKGEFIPGENLAELPPAIYIETFLDSFGVPMVFIPAGEFTMGSDDGDADAPPHQVYLDDYYIDKYEVTNQLMAQFLNEMGNLEEDGHNWFNPAKSKQIIQVDGKWQVVEGYENYPVQSVTWYGASAFCQWRGGSLPTEAQWEKAARGPESTSPYPWGKKLSCKLANYDMCYLGEALPIGSLPGNVTGYGVYDMVGNVAEFTNDWYHSEYYLVSPYENPQGPESTSFNRIVTRGGSWFSSSKYLRVFHRVSEFPKNEALSNVGFRCAALLP